MLTKGVRFSACEGPVIPFEVDVILPAQMWGGAGTQVTPEKRLMIAILEDAIMCLRKYHSVKRGAGRRLFQDARRWVLERGSAWEFSFQNICEALDIAAEDIRHCLRKELAVE